MRGCMRYSCAETGRLQPARSGTGEAHSNWAVPGPPARRWMPRAASSCCPSWSCLPRSAPLLCAWATRCSAPWQLCWCCHWQRCCPAHRALGEMHCAVMKLHALRQAAGALCLCSTGAALHTQATGSQPSGLAHQQSHCLQACLSMPLAWSCPSLLPCLALPRHALPCLA